MTEPRHNPECIGLVLAAGTGQRFGSDKRCAKLADGNSLLRATVCARKKPSAMFESC